MSTDDDIDDAIKVALVQASMGQVDRSTVDRALEILGMEVGGLRASVDEMTRERDEALVGWLSTGKEAGLARTERDAALATIERVRAVCAAGHTAAYDLRADIEHAIADGEGA